MADDKSQLEYYKKMVDDASNKNKSDNKNLTVIRKSLTEAQI